MYTCPNCGGSLKFDIKSQQLKCEHCHTKVDVYNFEKNDSTEPAPTDFEATVFTCPHCGGEILSADTSAAEFCSFCGSPAILHSRLTKEKRPSLIIPFKKTKEDCKEAYTKMMKKALFVPDALKNPKYIDGFRGIYMPYWSFHITQHGDFSIKGSKSRRRGDYVYTDHYNLTGELDAFYKGLSYDASSSFDDAISEKIAPYDVKDLKSFTPAFLSGFYADTADVDPANYEEQAKDIAIDQARKAISHEFKHMTTEPLISPSVLNTRVSEVETTMFPVWFLSYRNADRVAYATVNGQTGKVVADLPVDTKKYAIGSLLLALPIFLLLNIFFTITPSVLLFLTILLASISIIIYSTEIASIKKKEPIKPKKTPLLSSILAIVLCIFVVIFHPANDLYYYGASIVSLLAIFYSIKDIIYYYNILATRRLPQFDRTGGDDRA